VDGVPEREGRTPVREWLEQKLPTLVSYPLEAFRVHAVMPDTLSRIPAGKAVVVVDVGDSRLAPHQASFPPDAPQYFYRQGGKSVPAPHHYLEALRNRLTFAVLEPRLRSVRLGKSYRRSAALPVVELVLAFEVTNISLVPCSKWTVRFAVCRANGESPDYLASEDELQRRGGIPIPQDPTVLPTTSKDGHVVFGFRWRPRDPCVNKSRSSCLLRPGTTPSPNTTSGKSK
jgi:hypothetical protein